VTVALGAMGVRGVVLDVEGTTTPIAFAYEVLFPYARRELRTFLESHAAGGLLAEVARLLRLEHDADVRSGEAPPPLQLPGGDEDVTTLGPYVEWLMDRDRKSPGLKLLQGLIWKGGFEDGTLRGHFFPDVAPALERWRAASIDIAIYSSGSELAQRLIVGHAAAGDLTPLITRFFDATIGPKRSADSYRHIAAEMGLPAAECLFVSDVHAELEAASAAGMHALLCVRPGNAEAPRDDEPVVRSFEEIGA
jgi:enolase-phosphatase E1